MDAFFTYGVRIGDSLFPKRFEPRNHFGVNMLLFTRQSESYLARVTLFRLYVM